MTTTIQIDNSDLTTLTQFESSITHWSNEYAVLQLRARKALDGINDLYIARQKHLDDLLVKNNVDLKKVAGVQITPGGELLIDLVEAQ